MAKALNSYALPNNVRYNKNDNKNAVTFYPRSFIGLEGATEVDPVSVRRIKNIDYTQVICNYAHGKAIMERSGTELRYSGTRAAVAQNKYEFSCEAVSNYGHAMMLVKSAFDWLLYKREYELELGYLAAWYQILDVVKFEYKGKQETGFIISVDHKIKENGGGKTTLGVVSYIDNQGEPFEPGGGYFQRSTPPGGEEPEGGFRMMAEIEITADDALLTGYEIPLDISSLDFTQSDKSDRRLEYSVDGIIWNEINGWYGDVGEGANYLYFRLQAGIAAGVTDSTSYRIYYQNTDPVTPMADRNLIFTGYNDCSSIVPYFQINGAWTSDGEKILSPGINRSRIVLDLDTVANVRVYAKVNRNAGNNAGLFVRANKAAGTGWYIQIGAGNTFQRTWDTGAGTALNASVVYNHDNTKYQNIKYKAIGDDHEAWVAEDGTALPGAPQLVWNHANGNTDKYHGFMARNSANNWNDRIYICQGVANEPTAIIKRFGVPT